MTRPTQRALRIRFNSLGAPFSADQGDGERYEFHVSKSARDLYGLAGAPFSTRGGVVFADYAEARAFAARINERRAAGGGTAPAIRAGTLNAMALIDEVLHAVCAAYRDSVDPLAFWKALDAGAEALGPSDARTGLVSFTRRFPPSTVYSGLLEADAWLDGARPEAQTDAQDGTANIGTTSVGTTSVGTTNVSTANVGTTNGQTAEAGFDRGGRGAISLEELLLLRLENENPAFGPYRFLFDDRPLRESAPVDPLLDAAEKTLRGLPGMGPDGFNLPDLLRAPMRASPHSLAGQLDYMRRHWGMLLGDSLGRLLGGLDMLDEEERPRFPPGPGPSRPLSFSGLDHEYERFSEDKDWMPRVVMMAKSTLVWLDQLSKAYGREIRTLDAIPEEELDILASRGFNALWLIGIWERSQASRRIKELCGNPEAAPSAYSLFDYEIAWELGGWAALETLRNKARARGIRLAADMVPNHTGIDSAWVRDRPDLFISRQNPPFPAYSFTGENLSGDGRVGLWLEDHYYDRRDAAVTFKRVDMRNGNTSYIYHGNDGTSMPWNDTAQIDFLNPAAREAVKERILHVARNFPIIRFDAAMVLAKRSFRRLWYPEPGHGGAIASRFENAMDSEAFNRAIPNEFWREVVDMCAADAPETLLLAEAFWMMEGYFVRTLGMHRVYNSAFMNMLKEKKNAEYRATIRNTIEFDKDILKRFVNFMNNPDEETAVAQFGSGDHYFGVCSMMATMPGLPMFGHGQIEGFTEKYGMEYRRAYKDESPDAGLVQRHEREIVPLLKRRYLFSGVEEFLLYDLVRADGSVDENVFAYSNGAGGERALVLFNNAWERSAGSIRNSALFADKHQDGSKTATNRSLAQGLGLRCGPGRFTLLSETRSGLRYIRRSDDIAHKGLSVGLEGFQCQVFIDIREVDDDETGSYSRLCDALGGRGTADIGWALQDLALAELYRAWKQAYPDEWFKLAIQGASAPVDEQGLASFLAVAERYRASAGSGTQLDTASLAGMAARAGAALQKALGLLRMPDTLPDAAPDSAPATRPGDARETKPEAKAGAEPEAVPPAASESPTIKARIRAIEGGPEALAALAGIVPLVWLTGGPEGSSKAQALAESWGFTRKLREALVAAGSDWNRADRAASFAVAVLGRLDTVSGDGPARIRNVEPRTIATAFADDDEAQSLLGVNFWNGELWFDAERFRLGSMLMAAAAIAVGDAGTQAAEDTLAMLEEASIAAGWNVYRLLSAPSVVSAPEDRAPETQTGKD